MDVLTLRNADQFCILLLAIKPQEPENSKTWTMQMDRCETQQGTVSLQ